ncbi:hypothetical protein ACQP2F_29420 [Actinoplanes sp. CA-030573]|uniref:hypothetical protein n=1 Tax=Actinoplanes sp. CA-030573 TaxID=3239898 RepID=UPI003D930FB7
MDDVTPAIRQFAVRYALVRSPQVAVTTRMPTRRRFRDPALLPWHRYRGRPLTAESDDEPDQGTGDKLLQGLAAFGGVAGLATGVAFVFGRSYSGAYYNYFGLDVDQLGMSTQQLALHSMSVFWMLGFALASTAIVAVMLYAHWHHLTSDARFSTVRVQAVWVAVPMTLTVALTMPSSILGEGSTYWRWWWGYVGAAAWVLLAMSIGFLRMAMLRRRGSGDPPWMLRVLAAAVAVLAALWVFLGTYSYAQRNGSLAAHTTEMFMQSLPSLVVDSHDRLYFRGEGVSETRLASDGEGDDSGPRYRYTGLRLLGSTGDQLIVTAVTWRKDGSQSGSAPVLVLKTDSVRVQYVAGG